MKSNTVCHLIAINIDEADSDERDYYSTWIIYVPSRKEYRRLGRNATALMPIMGRTTTNVFWRVTVADTETEAKRMTPDEVARYIRSQGDDTES